MDQTDAPLEDPIDVQVVGFTCPLRYFLALESTGFGGPIAAVGHIQRGC